MRSAPSSPVLPTSVAKPAPASSIAPLRLELTQIPVEDGYVVVGNGERIHFVLRMDKAMDGHAVAITVVDATPYLSSTRDRTDALVAFAEDKLDSAKLSAEGSPKPLPVVTATHPSLTDARVMGIFPGRYAFAAAFVGDQIVVISSPVDVTSYTNVSVQLLNAAFSVIGHPNRLDPELVRASLTAK